MSWKSAIDSACTVLLSKDTDKVLKLKVTSGATTRYLYEITTTTVTEYRGLTESCANINAVSDAYNSDTRTYSDWQPFTVNFVGIRISGTKKTAKASRVNEAGGWRMTVTEVTVSSEVV
jgi:hypothetical protein